MNRVAAALAAGLAGLLLFGLNEVTAHNNIVPLTNIPFVPEHSIPHRLTRSDAVADAWKYAGSRWVRNDSYLHISARLGVVKLSHYQGPAWLVDQGPNGTVVIGADGGQRVAFVQYPVHFTNSAGT